MYLLHLVRAQQGRAGRRRCSRCWTTNEADEVEDHGRMVIRMNNCARAFLFKTLLTKDSLKSSILLRSHLSAAIEKHQEPAVY